MIHQLAQKLAKYLYQELNFNHSREAIIAYGLEILLGGIVKLISFTVIPVILGIFSQTWAAVIASTLFRLPAGGSHCTAYYRCLTGSIITFCLIGVLAIIAADFLPVNFMFFVAIGMAVLVVAIWVPADTEAKPVTRASARKKAKIWAYSVLVIYLSSWYYFEIPKDILLAGTLGLLVQSFTVTPQGYRVMDKLDRLFMIMSGPLFKKREVI